MTNELALNQELQSTLPFDAVQQYALLGHIVDFSNTSVFLQVKDRLQPEWFLNPFAAKLYDIYRKFYGEYKRTPITFEELMSTGEVRWMDPLERSKVTAAEKLSREHYTKFGKDTLLAELTQWMRVRVYHQSVEESARLFDNRKLTAAFQVLEKTVKEYQSIRFDGVPASEIWDYKAIAHARLAQLGDALSTGLPILDRKLNPDAQKGSLLRGEASLWLAGTNAGKTTFMQTIIQHNIRLGKRVLWVTLEGNQRALEEMLWCGILKVTREQYRTMALSDNPAFEGVFSAIAGLMKNNIIHLHSQRAGQTAEDVESMIRSHITNMKATSGHGFDLVVLDYPAILELGATHIKMEARQSTQKIYRRFFDLAGEENFHLCTAIQSNRESIKNSRGLNGFSGKNRLLTKESVSEAWGVAHDAPMVATLNRNDDDVTNNLLTVYIDKSRNGETGWAVTCRTDYARGRTHSEDLGAFAYRGTSSMADKANYLLESFKNKEITREQLKEFNNGKEEQDV